MLLAVVSPFVGGFELGVVQCCPVVFGAFCRAWRTGIGILEVVMALFWLLMWGVVCVRHVRNGGFDFVFSAFIVVR